MGWTEWLRDIDSIKSSIASGASSIKDLVMSNSIPTYDPEDDDDIDPQHFPYHLYTKVVTVVNEMGGESECLDKLENIFSYVKSKFETIILDLDRPIPVYKVKGISRSCAYYTLYMLSVEHELPERTDEIARVYSRLNRRYDVSQSLTSITMVNIIYDLVTDTFAGSHFILKDRRKMDMKERFQYVLHNAKVYPIISLICTDKSWERIYCCHRHGNRYHIVAKDYLDPCKVLSTSTKVVVNPSNFTPILPALPSFNVVSSDQEQTTTNTVTMTTTWTS